MVVVSNEDLFTPEGDVIETPVCRLVMETILLISKVGGRNPIPVHGMNLELRRCGFFLGDPQIALLLQKLHKDGLVQLSGSPEGRPSNLRKS